MITAEEARNNRRPTILDKISDAIKEVSEHGDSVCIFFDGEGFPYITNEQWSSIEEELKLHGYEVICDRDEHNNKTISIHWGE